jgi:hypothetical protein
VWISGSVPCVSFKRREGITRLASTAGSHGIHRVVRRSSWFRDLASAPKVRGRAGAGALALELAHTITSGLEGAVPCGGLCGNVQ